ncbi:hypothetical protein PVAND_001744 [Polypedilum vanderplanki]|uniref:Uncharacterized protein n=1 Tax=Polypedilum vanderplanki TaxID=319348 RepID=A0A9J6BPA5_POLVA|nr:hypothetical protein PVAND_001744 [Polypedilum vanderplanki]
MTSYMTDAYQIILIELVIFMALISVSMIVYKFLIKYCCDDYNGEVNYGFSQTRLNATNFLFAFDDPPHILVVRDRNATESPPPSYNELVINCNNLLPSYEESLKLKSTQNDS